MLSGAELLLLLEIAIAAPTITTPVTMTGTSNPPSTWAATLEPGSGLVLAGAVCCAKLKDDAIAMDMERAAAVALRAVFFMSYPYQVKLF